MSKGPNPGRLICLMRTGRELYKTQSDDDGVTWTPPHPHVFAGLDVYRTELWVDMLRDFPDFKGKPLDENNPDELRGAVVDPDLIEMPAASSSPPSASASPRNSAGAHPEHAWNGNYLAVSLDHGQTWSNVVRMTSGVLTTHYMASKKPHRRHPLRRLRPGRLEQGHAPRHLRPHRRGRSLVRNGKPSRNARYCFRPRTGLEW